ncbi:hypothetical protein M9H77_31476 [Catharanthus roseus]|uniref:Uncharacterized protein n=1 Tax=Catharanthus roseus TaxID=4058 RepID=A0ACC0A126_CATRO|nr:hypothetical protein M9H77_31476 [Catharanthus roseus]
MFSSQVSLERSGAPRATEVLGQEFLDQISPKGHIFMEGTLVDETSRTTSSSLSSYFLRGIIPEREPIPVIDLSDDESEEGPEMAPVAPGIGPGTSIEEDPTLPSLLRGGVREYDICSYCLWREQRVEAASQQVVALREEISRMDALFYAVHQARRQETARAAMLERELYWNFLVFRNMSGSQSPNRTDEVMSESSQNRQSEPMREATPHPEQATHKVIEKRNERVPATGADEPLERFLKFRPPEFYETLSKKLKLNCSLSN